MAGQAPTERMAGLLSPVAFGVGFLMLAFSPVIRGGNRHIALIALECIALIFFSLMLPRLWRTSAAQAGAHTPSLTRVEWAFVSSPLWLALLYLLPVPFGLWAALPGHGVYGQGLSTLLGGADGWRGLSLMPDQTITAVLSLIPIVAAFVLGRFCTPKQTEWLITGLLLVASAEAFVGLFQLQYFMEEWYFGAEFAGNPVGTFANPNHFANYIGMLIPLGLLWLTRSFPGAKRRKAKKRDVAEFCLWIVVLFGMVSALLASGSRAGVTVGVLVLVSSALVLGGGQFKKIKHLRWIILGALAAMACILFVALGARGVGARLGLDQLWSAAALRWQLTASSLQAAWAFFPFGAGPGAFVGVYTMFQPPGMQGAVEYAHNDYAQYLLELGVVFLVLFALFVNVFCKKSFEIYKGAQSRAGLHGSVKVQLFSAIGVSAILLHSLADFNLRIPANAMLAACLLGLFLKPATVVAPVPLAESEEVGEDEKVIIHSRGRGRRRGKSNNKLKRLKQWFGFDR
jgi:O-Antigen ligase